MLSSNSSSCNPFPENDITSQSQPDPNFLFTFPPLQYDDVSFLHHFLDTSFHTTTPPPAPAAAPPRKDRHSKINTARGPRDRRMRLSLDVARKFFDLQDLLGYDKASRTVDWLLRSSRDAIRELAGASSCRGSCTSEECSTTAAAAEAECCSKMGSGRRGKRGRQQKRASVGRESRKKARERARERTSQKRRLMREDRVFAEWHAHHLLMKEDSGGDADANGGEDFFFNFHHNNTADHTAAFLHQDEQIAEFQFNGKPWEAYNSFNLSG